jgi:hypothetical protein
VILMRFFGQKRTSVWRSRITSQFPDPSDAEPVLSWPQKEGWHRPAENIIALNQNNLKLGQMIWYTIDFCLYWVCFNV